MTYETAQYINDPMGAQVGIIVLINGQASLVPIDAANTDYRAITALVASSQLTIAPAPGT